MGLSPVVVIGGGLAGMAAALDLVKAGERVVLLERRPFLGGRAFSFTDPDSGAALDNGQHVLVGACTRLRAFLSAIDSPPGAFVRQPRLGVPILDPGGRIGRISAPRIPAPLHMAAALLGYRHLDLREKAAVARAVSRLARTDADERAELDAVPLGEWLAGRDMPRRAIERFWEPLIVPALNTPVAAANVPLVAFFLEQALWRGAEGGALWLPAVGLSEALGEPAGRALAARGVEIRLRTRVLRILAENADAVSGIELAGEERVDTRRIIAAVPPDALQELLPPGLAPHGTYASIGTSPIVNVYLWFDRPILPIPFFGTFGSPLQWVFDRTRLLGPDRAGGECVGISLSAAGRHIDTSKEALAAICDQALSAMFPQRRAARRTGYAVVKEPRATFLAGAGLANLRPGPEGPLEGLWLAGDWTDTGWPATMEGAVLSGERAAAHLIDERASAPAGSRSSS